MLTEDAMASLDVGDAPLVAGRPLRGTGNVQARLPGGRRQSLGAGGTPTSVVPVASE